MDRRAQLISEIQKALKPKSEKENYCIGFGGLLYMIDDIDFSTMQPKPKAKGIKNTRTGEVYSISGITVFF